MAIGKRFMASTDVMDRHLDVMDFMDNMDTTKTVHEVQVVRDNRMHFYSSLALNMHLY